MDTIYGGGHTQDVYTNGGGVYMGFKSTFSILPNTAVHWENNHATSGGAMHVHDASPIQAQFEMVGPYYSAKRAHNVLGYAHLPSPHTPPGIPALECYCSQIASLFRRSNGTRVFARDL